MGEKPPRTWPGDGIYDGLTLNPADKELARLWASTQGFKSVWRIEIKDGIAKVYQFADPPYDATGHPQLLEPVTRSLDA